MPRPPHPPHPSPETAAIDAVVRRALARVTERIESELASDLPPVARLCDHLERYRGKMLRPRLVIVSGLACGARAGRSATPRTEEGDAAHPVSDAHITVGAVCELIHLATLVHDDVLDEADIRRSGATINRLRGNEAAVILGDYLIAAAYHLCSTLDDQSTARTIGAVSMTVCAGELLQLHHRDDYSIDEPTYFELVERKTASLIAAAAGLGAAHAGASDADRSAMEDYGRKIGLAFQIQDDLLDLTGDENVVGKPTGKDLEKGKLTLPVIHHLAHASPGQRGRMLVMLEDPRRPGIVGALESTGSIEHARVTALGLVDAAVAAISPLPETPAKDYLRAIARAVVDRDY